MLLTGLESRRVAEVMRYIAPGGSCTITIQAIGAGAVVSPGFRW